LSSTCRATLFDMETRFSENIDFQFPMKKACAKEIELFCPKVPHGNARVIRCLQENKGKKDFSRPCLNEVLSYEQRAASDYRLNHRLAVMCRPDIENVCQNACDKDKEGGSRDQVRAPAPARRGGGAAVPCFGAPLARCARAQPPSRRGSSLNRCPCSHPLLPRSAAAPCCAA
jgi:hypothetical protein